MKKYVNIRIVKGNEGASIQVYDNKSSGYRVHGPKAWGNPYNRPSFDFKNVDVDTLIRWVNNMAFNKEEER